MGPSQRLTLPPRPLELISNVSSMENYPYFVSSAVVLVTIFLVDKWLDYTTPNLDVIPAVGPTGRLTSFIGAYRFFHNGNDMIREGIQKYKSAVFRIPMLDQWLVVLSQPKLLDDIRRARDEDLSFSDLFDQGVQTQYTFGRELVNNHYHADIIRTPLTRSIAARFPDIRDEIVAAFDEIVPKNDDWVSIRALDSITRVFSRTSNRLFVGLPLCRDPDYCDLATNFATSVFFASAFLNTIPQVFRLALGPLLSPMPRALKRCTKHLAPVITQRLQDDADFGVDREGRPNDLITWLIDSAPEEEQNTRAYIKRILMVNFVALNSSSNTFTQALFQLAHRPEYVQPLREEVESIVAEEGWSKVAIGKMRKLDSFLRECIRWEGPFSISISRRVQRPRGFTFSDGTHLPQGTVVVFATQEFHHSPENYTKPSEFDGFRFFNLGEVERELKSQLVDISPKHFVFGYGRHACPGRFFASIVLKAMLAHVVTNYDIKLETDIPPLTRGLAAHNVPDPDARILFKKRCH